jgi:general secretion pathway protein C
MLRRFFFPMSRYGWIQVVCFGLWAAVAFSAVTWSLKWLTLPTQAPGVALSQPSEVVLDEAQVARALGRANSVASTAAAPQASSRFELLGVVNAQNAQGVALISVDGQAAKPFHVGKTVADGLILQSTQTRQANLGTSLDAAPSLTLALPPKK